jgi:hypothetical protein
MDEAFEVRCGLTASKYEGDVGESPGRRIGRGELLCG